MNPVPPDYHQLLAAAKPSTTPFGKSISSRCRCVRTWASLLPSAIDAEISPTGSWRNKLRGSPATTDRRVPYFRSRMASASVNLKISGAHGRSHLIPHRYPCPPSCTLPFPATRSWCAASMPWRPLCRLGPRPANPRGPSSTAAGWLFPHKNPSDRFSRAPAVPARAAQQTGPVLVVNQYSKSYCWVDFTFLLCTVWSPRASG